MKRDLMLKTRELRKQGYSVKELHVLIGVSKSTISRWVQNVFLSEKAKARIRSRYSAGQIKSQEKILENSEKKRKEADLFAAGVLNGCMLDKNINMVLCAAINYCEGVKNVSGGLSFMNSDPDLIQMFVMTLRKGFGIDERKFRPVMHLHDYHNEARQKEFWSTLTGIPKSQFKKTYKKASDHRFKKEGYQGCLMVRYHDANLARKLHAIAKKLMERYK